MSDREDTLRRRVSSLNQTRRMFGHHRDDDAPEEPEKRIGDDRTDEDLEDELDELESNDW